MSEVTTCGCNIAEHAPCIRITHAQPTYVTDAGTQCDAFLYTLLCILLVCARAASVTNGVCCSLPRQQSTMSNCCRAYNITVHCMSLPA